MDHPNLGYRASQYSRSKATTGNRQTGWSWFDSALVDTAQVTTGYPFHPKLGMRCEANPRGFSAFDAQGRWPRPTEPDATITPIWGIQR